MVKEEEKMKEKVIEKLSEFGFTKHEIEEIREFAKENDVDIVCAFVLGVFDRKQRRNRNREELLDFLVQYTKDPQLFKNLF